MTTSVRRVALAALALAATPLAACTGGPAIDPGSAAVVDGTEISFDRVDELAAQLCELEKPALAEQGAALPMVLLRSVAVETLVTDALLPDFAKASRIDLPAVRRGVRDEVEKNLAAAPADIRANARERLRLEGARRTVLQLAGREGATSLEQATAQGAQAFRDWRAKQDVEVDPRFGSFDLDQLAWDGANGSLSVPTGAAAKDALDPKATAALPAGQRCGTPA